MTTDITTTKPKTVTCLLTARPPVRVRVDLWPRIAFASWHDGGEHEFQANRRASVRVRQHEDGRAVVYGEASSQWVAEPDVYAGYYLDRAASHEDLYDAIQRVAEEIGHDSLGRECIQDLPAEDLDNVAA